MRGSYGGSKDAAQAVRPLGSDVRCRRRLFVCGQPLLSALRPWADHVHGRPTKPQLVVIQRLRFFRRQGLRTRPREAVAGSGQRAVAGARRLNRDIRQGGFWRSTRIEDRRRAGGSFDGLRLAIGLRGRSSGGLRSHGYELDRRAATDGGHQAALIRPPNSVGTGLWRDADRQRGNAAIDTGQGQQRSSRRVRFGTAGLPTNFDRHLSCQILGRATIVDLRLACCDVPRMNDALGLSRRSSGRPTRGFRARFRAAVPWWKKYRWPSANLN